MSDKYEITVNKLHEILASMKHAGLGETPVVTQMHDGAPMPITEILNAPVGTREIGRSGTCNYIMSEDEAKTASDNTPQVIVLRGPQLVPVGWLGRALKGADDFQPVDSSQ